MLEINISHPQTEADRRYRILVLLARVDRPTHYKFHCPRCTMPVAELVNSEIIAMTDVMDMENPDLQTIGVRCDGRYHGSRCNMWFYYSLSSPSDNPRQT